MLRHMPATEPPPAAPERRVRLFRNGRNQALRIPKEYEIQGEEATIRKEGDRLIIEPIPAMHGLSAVLASLEELDEELPDMDEGLLPADPVDL